jgi:hypothetical protein
VTTSDRSRSVVPSAWTAVAPVAVREG